MEGLGLLGYGRMILLRLLKLLRRRLGDLRLGSAVEKGFGDGAGGWVGGGRFWARGWSLLAVV